ncbi:g6230 [Coccomyxa viridis]|uniref:G6230 protein n=1 Tax=Coccomyxa viridis TaxID=1274662 RepID=A0ABP1FX71_9CHLO
MATIEEEYVEGEEFDEEDDDAFEYEEEEDGEVEDADDEDDEEMIEAVPQEEMINIPGLGPMPIRNLPQGMGRPQPRVQPQSDAPQEWKGLRQHPASTQQVFRDLLSRMGDQGRKKLTILLLGKTGVGKSSTVNSILAETVAHVVVMQGPASRAQAISRTAAGFTLTLIDTPGVLEGDAVDGAALGSTLSQVRNRPVDIVLYLSRLDEFRVDASDVQVIEGITNRLGSTIWNNTFIGFTHGKLSSLPDGLTYDEYVERRAQALRSAIRKHSGAKLAELPVALIENSSRAPTNDSGEKLLGNKRAWLPDLMTEVADKAMQWSPYTYSPEEVKRNDPNKKRRWLIPLVLAAQIAFKVFVLDRVLEEDGITGDAYGPYDMDFVVEERQRVAREKERARRRKQASKGQQKRLPAVSSVIQDFDEDEDDDYEDDDYED